MEKSTEKWKVVFEASPVPMIIADEDARILYLNQAARDFFYKTEDRGRFGDLFQCLRATAKGCGRSEDCKSCVIRSSIRLAIAGESVSRQIHKAQRVVDGEVERLELMVSARPFVLEGQKRVIVAIEDVTEVVYLRKIIPICMHCKRIRDDEKFWHALEEYMSRYHGVQLSHGLCPECARKFYPEIFNKESPPEEF